MAEIFLRLPDVQKTTGLKRSSIYEKIADGSFPKPVPITSKAVAWLESEIAAWQRTRIEARDEAA